ncbi:MAG: pyridoxine 5'-phosphate synthase [Deltaproteobacteria bacterium]|nr:pyridoxine 5'-phosphate synthase [Deltaproteobacteria bacterium]
MVKLGVNIDHVATLRQARGTRYPDPVAAAALAEQGGADQITVHLREDRRHIQEVDVRLLRRSVQTELNLEMALTSEMIDLARSIQPNSVTLVPEKRAELTTEGGLDLGKVKKKLGQAIPLFKQSGIRVSLFINSEEKVVRLASELAADAIELHTGSYADAKDHGEQKAELEKLRVMAKLGRSLNLSVAAGHGLHYENVSAVVEIPEIEELNIGHSIVARAVFVGMEKAVREMKVLLS